MAMKSSEEKRNPATLTISKRNGILSECLKQDINLLIERIKKDKKEIMGKRVNPSIFEEIRPEIIDSWIRSYYYGLDHLNFKDGPVMAKPKFEELLSKEDYLIKAAHPYITRQKDMLSDTDFLILLTNAYGVLLGVHISNNKVLEHVNKKFNLVPGVVWTEQTVGTCSHVMCRLLKSPIQLTGPEFYSHIFYDATCSSAPIYDIYGNLAGSYTIVSPFSCEQNPHLLALAVHTAWNIQKELQLKLNKELLCVALDAVNDAVITVNKSGAIIGANLEAKKLFTGLDKDIIGMDIENVLGAQTLINYVLQSGNPVFDADIEIRKTKQKLCLHSVQPVRDHVGKIYGCLLTLKKVSQSSRRSLKINHAKSPETRYTFDSIIGSSANFLKAVNMAKKLARSDVNILIQGESGTGKEMFAQAIHHESRPDGPFIAINCAALPRTLIESELFGYEGGSFTGAHRQGRPGKIELAHEGTLFLDEIGDMPVDLQPVLLRVLEEKKIMRVGGSRYIPVNFRLITATNKNLQDLMRENLFRHDLYYRLEAFKINIPPLRERGLDIVRLAKHFIETIAKKHHIPAPVLSNEAIFHLLKYSWPGNVRQLENAMLFAVNMSSGGVIKPEDLPAEITEAEISHYTVDPDLKLGSAGIKNNLSIKEMEVIMIIQALLQTNNNVSEAAKILNLSRSTLYRKIKEYNLYGEIRKKRA